MRDRKFGRIVNISSINGQKGQAGQGAGSTAAKAGDIGFTRALAQEGARAGITVNAIAPGYIGTEMVRAIDEKVLNERIIPQIPVGRLGEPEEIARCVVLADHNAGFITGSTISANGGEYLPHRGKRRDRAGLICGAGLFRAPAEQPGEGLAAQALRRIMGLLLARDWSGSGSRQHTSRSNIFFPRQIIRPRISRRTRYSRPPSRITYAKRPTAPDRPARIRYRRAPSVLRSWRRRGIARHPGRAVLSDQAA